jgi:hypothetical protein
MRFTRIKIMPILTMRATVKLSSFWEIDLSKAQPTPGQPKELLRNRENRVK